MKWRGAAFVLGALAGCGDGTREVPALPPLPSLPSLPWNREPVRLSFEVVEGETVVIPFTYHRTEEPPLEPSSVVIGLEASYRTASAEDILLMERTRVWLDRRTGTVELGLLARQDDAVEGAETLVLRPALFDGVDLHGELEGDLTFGLQEAEVVITDGLRPCSGVDVRAGKPALVTAGVPWNDPKLWQPWQLTYSTEIVVEAPAGSEQVFEWLSPPDRKEERTRTFTAWRVERLGDRVRHQFTAQWWSGFGGPWPPPLELQVCGGSGTGKFVRCSPSECAVHDEAF